MKKSMMKPQAAKTLAGPELAPVAGQSAQQVQVPLIYADAIGNVLMTPITSRVTLTLNVGPAKDGIQPTTTALELVIPTPSLLNFAKQIQELLQKHGPELAKAYEAAGKQVSEFGPKPKK